MPIAAMVQDPFPLGQQGGLWRGHQGRTGQEGQGEELGRNSLLLNLLLNKAEHIVIGCSPSSASSLHPAPAGHYHQKPGWGQC